MYYNDQKLYEFKVDNNMFSVSANGVYIGSGSTCKKLTVIMVRDYINCHCTCFQDICLHLKPSWQEFIGKFSGVLAINYMSGGTLCGVKICGVTIREIAEIFKGQEAENGK